MQFTPMGDRVLVKPNSKQEVLASGIIVPDTAQERPDQGTVIAVGPDVNALFQGDKVMFIGWAGIKVKVNGEEHLVLAQNEVLGKLAED